MESPSILAETGHVPLPRLEVEEAAMPPLVEDAVRVSNPASSSGTGAGPQVLTSWRPTSSSTFGLVLQRGR